MSDPTLSQRTDETRRLLRIRVVADELDISIRSVWRLIEQHELETVRVLRNVRITRASLDAFVERGGSKK